MRGRETLKRIGGFKSGVFNKKLVQQRGAASPMAQDEYRGLTDFGFLEWLARKAPNVQGSEAR